MLAMRTHSVRASMRPGDFSPGNTCRSRSTRGETWRTRFNEAGGFLPRKRPSASIAEDAYELELQ